MTRELLDEYAVAGVARVVQFLPPETEQQALAVMDHCAQFVGGYR